MSSSKPENTAPGVCAAAPFYSGDAYQIEESVGYLLRHVLNSLTRQIDAGMQAHDLTATQWGPLLLMARGRGDTAADLARATAVDTGAMTRMLDRLQAKGLLERKRSDADRRVVHLALTDEGKQVSEQIPYCLAQVLNQHLTGFSEAELDQLKSLLRRMLDNGRAIAAASQTNAQESP